MDIEEFDGSMLLVNDHVCKVKGKGKVKFIMEDGTFRILIEYIL